MKSATQLLSRIRPLGQSTRKTSPAIDEADRLQTGMLNFYRFAVQRFAYYASRKLYILGFAGNQFGTWIAMKLKYQTA
jgi:hypothetical protein